MNEAELIRLGQILGSLAIVGFYALNSRSQLRRSNKALRELLISSQKRELYLASIIDKHEIELTEFDLIALTSPSSKKGAPTAGSLFVFA